MLNMPSYIYWSTAILLLVSIRLTHILFTCIFKFQESNILTCLYTVGISALSEKYLTKIYSHFVGCLFTVVFVSFAVQKFLTLILCQLLILGTIYYTTKVLIKKSLFLLITSRSLLILSAKKGNYFFFDI